MININISSSLFSFSTGIKIPALLGADISSCTYHHLRSCNSVVRGLHYNNQDPQPKV
jgi:hypothetical protein